MNPLLNKNLFFIKEKVGMFKASNIYDIFDPETNKHLMTSKEPHLGAFTKIFRFTKYKKLTLFNVLVTETSGKKNSQYKTRNYFFSFGCTSF